MCLNSKMLPAAQVPSRRSPRHRVQRTYTPAERQLYVDMMTRSAADSSFQPLTPREISFHPGAPPLETLRYWRREFSHPRAPHKRKGAVCLLTTDEQHVLAGYAVHLLRHDEVVSGEVLVDFVATSFNKTIDKSWVSRHMHALGFSSRRPGGRSRKYTKPGALQSAIRFVEDTRPQLSAFADKARTVAMDEVSFFENGLVTSCYAPIGR